MPVTDVLVRFIDSHYSERLNNHMINIRTLILNTVCVRVSPDNSTNQTIRWLMTTALNNFTHYIQHKYQPDCCGVVDDSHFPPQGLHQPNSASMTSHQPNNLHPIVVPPSHWCLRNRRITNLEKMDLNRHMTLESVSDLNVLPVPVRVSST